jgi:hypothetical protein
MKVKSSMAMNRIPALLCVYSIKLFFQKIATSHSVKLISKYPSRAVMCLVSWTRVHRFVTKERQHCEIRTRTHYNTEGSLGSDIIIHLLVMNGELSISALAIITATVAQCISNKF